MVRLFVSYAHRDNDLRAELQTHLSMLKRQRVIQTWYDGELRAGEAIDERIREELEKADVILLLVSPYFLDSDYCYNVEMERALQRHHANTARLIPVILHPCDWKHAPFGGLKAVPHDGAPVSTFANRHEAFLQITTAIREAVTEIASPGGSSAAPAALARRTPSRSQDRPSRSSIRIRKEFTDRDRDAFLEDAFARISEHFESSLRNLEKENEDVATRFKRRGDSAFTATVYVRGVARAECKVWYADRGAFDHGIAFSHNPSSEGSFNEQFTIEEDDYSLSLKPLGMALHGGHRGPMTSEEAAEYYWQLFTERLR